MSPRYLRARCRVDAPTMALRLRISVPDLATLERTPLRLWELDALERYVKALGCELHIQALGRDFIVALD